MLELSLGFTLAVGARLMVISNNGLEWIGGHFTNLPQGAEVWLTHGGNSYRFIANYHGGDGNDLVLEWPGLELAGWGRNDAAQLALPRAEYHTSPRQAVRRGLFRDKEMLSIVAGFDHSLALCGDGTIFGWGSNWHSQLGFGSSSFEREPTMVPDGGALAGREVVALAAGKYFSVALCKDGTALGWGMNTSGQLGTPSPNYRTSPTQIPMTGVLAGKRILRVAAGDAHTLALCSDGSVVSWGSDADGQLGDGAAQTQGQPVLVDQSGVLSGRTVSMIGAGRSQSFALCTDGTLVAWGKNLTGELGIGTFQPVVASPALVTQTGALSGKTITSITGGKDFTLALCADGALVGWGSSLQDQLGLGSAMAKPNPFLLNGGVLASGAPLVKLAASDDSGLMLRSDGMLAVWGGNSYNHLGIAQPDRVSVPVTLDPVPAGSTPGTRAVDLVTGSQHTLALLASPALPEARLSLLALDGAALSPAFEPDRLSYSTSSAVSAESLQVIATTMDPNAEVRITQTSGSVVVTVTAYAGTTREYTVAVTPSAPVSFTFTEAGQAAVTTSLFNAAGLTATLALGFEPAAGTTLKVIENTGLSSIHGNFANLVHGQRILLSHGGKTYPFIVNYFGGSGNDLVLEWGLRTLHVAGANHYGQLGTGEEWMRTLPGAVRQSGALQGRQIAAVSSGASHHLVLTSDGAVIAWGRNEHGQLGDGSRFDRGEPEVISTGALAGKTVVKVAAGTAHSLALCTDGTLVAWGANFYGQLGDGTKEDRDIPISISGNGALIGKVITSLSAGGEHNLVLCEDGSIVGWGDAFYAQCGPNGVHPSTTLPVLIPKTGAFIGKTPLMVSAGGYHSLALFADGSIASWGSNSYGELGIGSNLWSQRAEMQQVVAGGALSGKTPTAIASGQYHNLVRCSDGSVVSWGLNDNGQLGDGTRTLRFAPVTVPQSGLAAGNSVVSLHPGMYHSFALLSDGRVAGWGWNHLGELGDGTQEDRLAPMVIDALAGSTGISAGYSQGVAWSSTGLSSWGDNSDGALGAGTMPFPRLPVPVRTDGVLRGKTILRVSGGAYHSVALCSDGTLAAWGKNDYGQLGDGTATDSALPVAVKMEGVLAGRTVVAISAGTDFTIALCSDGKVVGWGLNSFGQLADNSFTNRHEPVDLVPGEMGGRSIAQISAGALHTLALCTDGQVVGWGYNAGNRLADGSTAFTNAYKNVPVVVNRGVLAGQSATAVAAGGISNLVLCANGRVAFWGGLDQLPAWMDASGVLAGKSITAIQVGREHQLMLCADGTVAARGDHREGQLGLSLPTLNSLVPVATDLTALDGGRIVGISSKYDHSLAITNHGTVAAWGLNRTGQLANGTSGSPNSARPIILPAGGTPITVEAGYIHSLFLTAADLSTDSTLSELSVDAGTLGPAFVPGIHTYSITVPANHTGLVILARPADPFATVTVNGQPAAGDDASSQVELLPGTNAIQVKVVSSDASHSTDYVLRVVRGNFSEWINEHAPADQRDAIADPDGDGLVNLLEYVLNGDPAKPEEAHPFSLRPQASGSLLTFTRQASASADTIQTIQYSHDLAVWHDIVADPGTAGVSFNDEDLTAGLQQVIVQIPAGTSGLSAFVRMKVVTK